MAALDSAESVESNNTSRLPIAKIVLSLGCEFARLCWRRSKRNLSASRLKNLHDRWKAAGEPNPEPLLELHYPAYRQEDDVGRLVLLCSYFGCVR